MNKLIACCLIVVLSFSCNKDEPIIPIPIPETGFDFGDLKVGDEMAFVRFESSCDDFQRDFRLTGDTLIWRVSAMNDGAGVLSEKFTDDSPLASNLPKIDMTVSTSSDYILIPDRWSSNLFFFYGNDTLWVNPAATVPLKQNNCQLVTQNQSGFVGDAIASIDEMRLGQFELGNMTVVSCEPGGVIDAYIIYNDGKIKTIYSQDWDTGIPSGWIAIN